MFIHFISRQGGNLLVNIKDISFVVQKVFFVKLISGGGKGSVIVENDFSDVCLKIKNISSRVNDIEKSMSDEVMVE